MNLKFKNYLQILLKKQDLFFFEKTNFVLNIEKNNIKDVFLFLKDNESSQFKILIDIITIDYCTKKKRFCVIYCVLSIKYNIRLFIKCYLNFLISLQSITNLYKAACWLEREVFDMFGIFFNGSPDLRRILTDYGFEGHPLKKDFPLSGFLETRFDDTQKRVVFDIIEMTQEYRFFKFKSSWN